MVALFSEYRIATLAQLREEYPGATFASMSNLAGVYILMGYQTHKTDGSKMVCPRWSQISTHHTEQAAQKAYLRAINSK